MIRIRGAVVGIAVVSALTFAACGGGADDGGADTGNGDTGGGGTEVSLTANDNSFDPKKLSVPAGAEVTVDFHNAGENPHTFTSADLDVDTGIVEPGDSTTVTFTAPDAKTEFICTIHETMGMTGKIVLE